MLVQYFVSGSLIIVLSWAMTGCRFGNRVEQAAKVNADPITGYYETHAQELTFCAEHANTASGGACETADIRETPSLLASFFTDPVWVTKDSEEKLIQMRPYTSKEGGLIFPHNEAYELEAKTLNPDPELLWVSDKCAAVQLIRLEKGQLLPAASGPYPISVLGVEIKAQGRAQMDAMVSMAFEGDCEEDLLSMYACYTDPGIDPAVGPATCRGKDAVANQENQAYVKSVFDPYIQARVMQPEDIPTVRALGFSVTYR